MGELVECRFPVRKVGSSTPSQIKLITYNIDTCHHLAWRLASLGWVYILAASKVISHTWSLIEAVQGRAASGRLSWVWRHVLQHQVLHRAVAKWRHVTIVLWRDVTVLPGGDVTVSSGRATLYIKGRYMERCINFRFDFFACFFNILITFTVISRRVLTCESAQSWRLYKWCPTGRPACCHHDPTPNTVTSFWYCGSQYFRCEDMTGGRSDYKPVLPVWRQDRKEVRVQTSTSYLKVWEELCQSTTQDFRFEDTTGSTSEYKPKLPVWIYVDQT